MMSGRTKVTTSSEMSGREEEQEGVGDGGTE